MKSKITKEHVDNNYAVRDMLKDRGIKPEQLPPGEDTAKVKRRLIIDERNIIKAANKKTK